MPTRGGKRRGAKRAAMRIMAAQPAYPRPDKTPARAAANTAAGQPIRHYDLSKFVGGKLSELDQRLTWEHMQSDAATQLFRDGYLEIFELDVSPNGWKRTIYLVAAPTDLELKVAAFEERLWSLITEYNPEGHDFKFVVAPLGYWQAQYGDHVPRQDYWHAFGSGLIWTLDRNAAFEIRRRYSKACKEYRSHLYDLVNHCSHCESCDIVYGYNEGAVLGEESLRYTCNECGGITSI